MLSVCELRRSLQTLDRCRFSRVKRTEHRHQPNKQNANEVWTMIVLFCLFAYAKIMTSSASARKHLFRESARPGSVRSQLQPPCYCYTSRRNKVGSYYAILVHQIRSFCGLGAERTLSYQPAVTDTRGSGRRKLRAGLNSSSICAPI